MRDSLAIPTPSPRDWLAEIRPAMRAIEESGIDEIVERGRRAAGLIPLWVGEGDRRTPDFIVAAAKASLDRGETFYTHQAGIPELREAIARYLARLHGAAPGGQRFSPARFHVTIGAMQALDIAIRLTVGPGEEALVPSPAWPNFAGALAANGARARFVALARGTRWRLDAERLAEAVTPSTRAILFNSPANPTGYVATREELAAVLDVARRGRLWIIADEIYGRLTYDGQRAPSFHDIMAPDDKILFVQTLSKNWAMTGWRIGWLEAPPALGPTIVSLIQYSTSGVPVPAQRAAVAALDHGEAFLADTIARARVCRDIMADGLSSTGRARFSLPDGAIYLFCQIDGEADSRALALRLIEEAGVGVAPGAAFGPGGEGHIRLCFARAPEDIVEATRRFAGWLAGRGRAEPGAGG
jgi:aspartate/methionine/tyrosine aminotransferase